MRSWHYLLVAVPCSPPKLTEGHVCVQMSVEKVEEIPGPITAEGPKHVPGEKSLTQSFSGPLEDETYLTRGYDTPSKVRNPPPQGSQ